MGWKVVCGLLFLLRMKFSNVFLLLVFIAAGYVAYPYIHPKVAESPAFEVVGVVSEKVKEQTAKVKESAAPIEKVTEPSVEKNAVPESRVAEVAEAVKPEVEEVDVYSEEASAVRKAMKQSLMSGAVTEFSVQDVKKVEVESPQNRDGVSYEVGSVTIKDLTIFGEQETKVIALIQNGKVQKWLWMPSEMEVQ